MYISTNTKKAAGWATAGIIASIIGNRLRSGGFLETAGLTVFGVSALLLCINIAKDINTNIEVNADDLPAEASLFDPEYTN